MFMPPMVTTELVKTSGNRSALLPNTQFISACMKIEMPMVAMMTEITGSPIRGRSTTTWMTRPKMVMNTRLNTKAAAKGRPISDTSHRQAQAPSTTNSPWAKFTTWVDL